MKNRVKACIVGLVVLFGTLSVASATDYTYDALQRLTRVAYDNGTCVAYSYDAAGNIVSQASFPRRPPVLTARSPAANPAAVSEGASVAFSLTANDTADLDVVYRGMSNITWYVDGTVMQTTKATTTSALTSPFTFMTDANTVTGAAFRDVEIRAVALDRQGDTTGTNWTVRVNNLPASQTITFKALPVMELGGTNYNTGAKASSGLPIVYSNSNPTVAQIVGDLIQIVGAGTAVITATQPGSEEFKAAVPVSQTLTVKARVSASTPLGGGTVTGTGLYAPGTKVALTAKPAANNTFLRWEDGSQAVARSLVMPHANVAAQAWFGPTASVTPPVVVSPGAQQAMVGVPFSLPLTISSASLPTVTVTGLPAGLVYTASTKTIIGVPTAAVSNKAVTVTAKNVNKTAGTSTFLLTVAPLPLWAQGNFNGWFAAGVSDVGPVSADVTAQGKITGKLSSLGTNYAFSAVSYARRDGDGAFWLTTTAKVAKVSLPLTLAVRNPAVLPNLSAVDGWFANAAEGDPVAALWRNVWKDADMAAVATNYTGYYTAALPGSSTHGSGYLTFTVDKLGGVKTVGKLADGTAVSLAGPLVLDDAGRVFAVPYTSPVTYKGGCLFGLAGFFRGAAGSRVTVRLIAGEPFLWESRDPQATQAYGAGFSRELGLAGGWYDTLGNLYAYYTNRTLSIGTLGAPAPETLVGTNRTTSAWWDPDGLALTATTNKSGVLTGLAAPKAGVPVDPDKDHVWDYGATNTVGLTLTLSRPTGVLKGTFKAWFDTSATHTSASLAFEGVLTPERENPNDGVAGRGFFLWPDKSQYLNPQGKPVPYGFNWSHDLKLLLSDL